MDSWRREGVLPGEHSAYATLHWGCARCHGDGGSAASEKGSEKSGLLKMEGIFFSFFVGLVGGFLMWPPLRQAEPYYWERSSDGEQGAVTENRAGAWCTGGWMVI